MTRAVVFVSAAMVAASLGLFAQDISGGARNSNQVNTQPAVNVVGCVNTSASGAYSLTDEHGATYALSGSTSTLEGRNSQRVEITGKKDASSEASSSTSVPMIQVTSTKVLADNCSTSGTPALKMASTALPSGENAENGGQLPQTSTILPLLGLIGLGSLVAGFFARQ
jgi:hypothetical protein